MAISRYPEPTVEFPGDDAIMAMVDEDEECTATDGCGGIEPDGTCEHGYPAWPLHLGLI